MATERLIIEVSEKGALVVKRNLEDIGKGAQKAGGAVQLLQRALGLIATGMLIKQIVGMADEYTNLQNRLKLVTKDQAELGAVTNELFAISERTRSSFSATGEMYARVALASKSLGKSQSELLQFTESLNQAIILSGASAAEAQAGMIQLSQGIASGTLRGDELRSVLEQLPMVADVIAKSLGVTRGQLRLMGQDGKITADIVLKAFAEARGELADKFAKTVPTVGQAMTVLKNSFMGLVGSVSSASGASSSLAQGILDIAKLVPKLKEPLMVLADTVLATFRAFGDLFKTAGDALKSMGTSWGEVFQNIGLALLALLRTATQVIDKTVGLVLGLAGFIVEGGKALFEGKFKDMGSIAGAAFKEGFNQTALTDIMDKVVAQVQDSAAKRAAEARFPAKAVDLTTVPKAEITAADTAEFDKHLKQLRDEAELLKMGSRERAIHADLLKTEQQLLQGTNKTVMTDAQKTMLETQLRTNQALSEESALLDSIRGPQEAYNQGLATLERIKPSLTLEEYNEQLRQLKENLRNARPEFDQYLEGLRRQGELMGLTPKEAEVRQQMQSGPQNLTPEQQAQAEAQLRANQALADQTAMLDNVRGPQRDYQLGLANANALLAQGKINQDEYNKQVRQLKTDLTNATGQMDVMGEIWGSVWNSASSALDSFVETGKLSFSDLAGSILMDIQKIIMKLMLMQAFKAIGIPIPGFATGGSFMVGGAGGTDSQLVAFRASPNERVDISTPGQQQQSDRTVVQSAPPMVKIVNVFDEAAIQDAMASENGEKVVLNVIRRNAGSVRQAIS